MVLMMKGIAAMFLTPRQYFRRQGSQPRKRFGQHFLEQTATAQRIVHSAGLTASDVVVEVGPGLGALTQFIPGDVEELHLVELDRDLAEYLDGCLESASATVHIHRQDVLTFDFQALSQSLGKRLVIVGNLPYNISSPLLFRLVKAAPCLKHAVFMVQKEVGERLLANPGTKSYGVLSVLLGACARVSRLFEVGAAQFYPPPRVDSLVVRIDFTEGPVYNEKFLAFFRCVVNCAFQQRRKILLNSLRSILAGPSAQLAEACLRVGIDPGRRPETLSVIEFIGLSEALLSSVEKQRTIES